MPRPDKPNWPTMQYDITNSYYEPKAVPSRQIYMHKIKPTTCTSQLLQSLCVHCQILMTNFTVGNQIPKENFY